MNREDTSPPFPPPFDPAEGTMENVPFPAPKGIEGLSSFLLSFKLCPVFRKRSLPLRKKRVFPFSSFYVAYGRARSAFSGEVLKLCRSLSPPLFFPGPQCHFPPTTEDEVAEGIFFLPSGLGDHGSVRFFLSERVAKGLAYVLPLFQPLHCTLKENIETASLTFSLFLPSSPLRYLRAGFRCSSSPPFSAASSTNTNWRSRGPMFPPPAQGFLKRRNFLRSSGIDGENVPAPPYERGLSDPLFSFFFFSPSSRN